MSVTQFDDDMVPRDIALVFAANNSFASGFLVTLASALACSDLGRFKIYFLHDEEEDVSRLVAQAKRICRQFNYPVDYFDVLPVNLTEFKVCESYVGNHLAYARLYAIRNLKEDILLYLDSDMLVLKDLSELIQLLPEDFKCGAVRDAYIAKQSEDGYRLDGKVCLDDADYFNSGVLVINSSECVNYQFDEKFNNLKNRLSNPSFGDQSYLNVIFRNEWFKLPEQWNRFTSEKHQVSDILTDGSVSLLHFVTVQKPWRHAFVDSANILWHSVAQSIGVCVEPSILNELTNEIRSLRIRKATGGTYFSAFVYLFVSRRSKSRKRFYVSMKLAKEMACLDEWLREHGFNGVPPGLKL